MPNQEYKNTLEMISQLDEVRVSLWNKGGHDKDLVNLDMVLLNLRIKARELRKKIKVTT